MSISVVILARDEERMIGAALASAAFADEVVVIDAGSTDGTKDIATRAGARVVERPFDDFARQRNFALEQAAHEWVLFLDADERITPELAREARAATEAADAHAYAIPRRNLALGRWLTWTVGSEDAPVRLMRRGRARWTGSVHEFVEASQVGRLRSPLVHLTHRSVSEVVRKVDNYSEYEAADLIAKGVPAPSARAIVSSLPKALWGLWRSGLRKEAEAGAVEAVLLAFNRALVLAKVWERAHAERIAEAYARAEREIADLWARTEEARPQQVR